LITLRKGGEDPAVSRTDRLQVDFWKESSMKNRFAKVMVVMVTMIACLAAGAVSADEVKYAIYENGRFGYAVAYPEGLLIPQGEAENGDGQRFLSKEEDAELAVWGSHNALDETLKERYDRAAKGESGKRSLTYRTIRKTWFAVSGTEGDRVFYEKTLLRNGVFYTCLISYPKSKKGTYDRITSVIEKSFKVSGTR
jgi:hypothetical protein